MLQLLPQELAVCFRVILDVVLDEFDPVPVFLFQLIDDGLLLNAGRSSGAVEVNVLRLAVRLGDDAFVFDIANSGCDFFLFPAPGGQRDQRHGHQDRQQSPKHRFVRAVTQLVSILYKKAAPANMSNQVSGDAVC